MSNDESERNHGTKIFRTQSARTHEIDRFLLLLLLLVFRFASRKNAKRSSHTVFWSLAEVSLNLSHFTRFFCSDDVWSEKNYTWALLLLLLLLLFFMCSICSRIPKTNTRNHTHERTSERSFQFFDVFCFVLWLLFFLNLSKVSRKHYYFLQRFEELQEECSLVIPTAVGGVSVDIWESAVGKVTKTAPYLSHLIELDGCRSVSHALAYAFRFNFFFSARTTNFLPWLAGWLAFYSSHFFFPRRKRKRTMVLFRCRFVVRTACLLFAVVVLFVLLL